MPGTRGVLDLRGEGLVNCGMTEAAPSLIDRTLGNLKTVWAEAMASARATIYRAPRPDLPPEDQARLKLQMRACLDGTGGEISARARAAALGETYLALNGEGQQRFLRLLATGFAPDAAAVDLAMDALRAAEPALRRRAERALAAALEPPRVRLLRQFTALPAGVKFLVDLRATLIDLARLDPDLAELEADLKSLLSGWFDIGFLDLQVITWKSPAALLEKLIAYEAVHAIRSWDDLKNRLDSDRRCFAFFHPRLPEEPLIFVEVALVDGLADNVGALLDETAPTQDPHSADTAIFYSISNAQKGLAGISFGGFLIKQVVEHLRREFPSLKTFATLSPIPGFARWVEPHLTEAQSALLVTPDWPGDPAAVAILKKPLLRLAAQYLARTRTPGGRAIDPVANFHLSNGARIERLNWLGDLSVRGRNQSHGLMVNYLYKLDSMAANHEAYAGEGEIAMSSGFKALLKS